MRTTNKLTVTNLTHLGLLILPIIDSDDDFDLTDAEIYEAADHKRLLAHLSHRLRGRADLFLLTSLAPDHVSAIENALSDAASSLDCGSRETPETKKHGLCELIAIILEALQQNFSPIRYQPGPDEVSLAPAARN